MIPARGASVIRLWRWCTDTLAKRLFLLMWAALVGSHLLAFATVHMAMSMLDERRAERPPGGQTHLPTFPSLPPTPGMPDAARAARHDEPHGGPRGEPLPHGEPPFDAAAPPPSRDKPTPQQRRGGLPTPVLLLDYGVRLIVIALAAWLASRWLAAPMGRLAGAARDLGAGIGAGAPPALDEGAGTREVRETAAVFNRMARRLQQQFDERGLLVAAISHDLRTPLTRLRMRLETMDAEEQLRERSARDIAEMNELIDTVLELFRRDAAGGTERARPIDVAALVQALVDDLAEQGQQVSCEGAASVIATTDAGALRRIVGNLVANALRYAGDASIGIEVDAATIRVSVADNGPGIPPDRLEMVFQPFYRLEGSRNRDTGGIGLGLYIARDLAQRLGGTLTLANRADRADRARANGLVATLTLPRR